MRFGSFGYPSYMYDVILTDEESKEITQPDEPGHITIRLSNWRALGLFHEYIEDPEKTQNAFQNNLYFTGDKASFDKDGYWWFIGRADDVIKSSDYRVGPFEVESALMTHPAVVECAITGVPDEIRGQVVKATIILSKEYRDKAGDELIKEIQDHVKSVTAPYK